MYSTGGERAARRAPPEDLDRATFPGVSVAALPVDNAERA